ncbi:hypothetical protein CYLTODRAFT_15310 [Cylindrobasidium torrendii FP15055 ss-10]|uniref:G-protein coupled receptors family 1 profile domain-containing protein n=1 Tax=Cylindrobasidium torrendii FP15055 ss-10 TaxID=1314674 RepID=A0A0D7BAA2_9AGAR|nr:hypothetical protein CYLTODRAFT_15310 [Cylindrobasidium torrendii FP15055 ss-10]
MELRRFIQNPMDIFMLSLFVVDLFQALGSVLDVKWISEGSVQIGPVCTAQGVLQQLGETRTGVAITTLFIAVYTFLVILNVSSQKASRRLLAISFFLVFLSWLFLIMMTILGVRKPGQPLSTITSLTRSSEVHSRNYLSHLPSHAELMVVEYVWFWRALAIHRSLLCPRFMESRQHRTF